MNKCQGEQYDLLNVLPWDANKSSVMDNSCDSQFERPSDAQQKIEGQQPVPVVMFP